MHGQTVPVPISSLCQQVVCLDDEHHMMNLPKYCSYQTIIMPVWSQSAYVGMNGPEPLAKYSRSVPYDVAKFSMKAKYLWVVYGCVP